LNVPGKLNGCREVENRADPVIIVRIFGHSVVLSGGDLVKIRGPKPDRHVFVPIVMPERSRFSIPEVDLYGCAKESHISIIAWEIGAILGILLVMDSRAGSRIV
jgi:hypothetical protein